jgi:hypothetical protein
MKTNVAPGAYNPKDLHAKKSFTIARRNSATPKCTPGPCEYKIQKDLKAACTKLGLDSRDSYFLRNHTIVNPSSNKYGTPSTALVKPSSASFGFGSSSREKSYMAKNPLPGPGAYLSKSLIGDAPARSMPGRGKDLRPKTGTIGPGAAGYHPSIEATRKSTPNFSMSKGIKFTSKTTKEAGNSCIYTITGGPSSVYDNDLATKPKASSWV